MQKVVTSTFATCLAALLSITAVHAQAPKTARVITPQTPGSASDLMSRGIAEALSNTLGQTTIVENRPGASGLIAGQACAQGAPDGQTLCLLDASNAVLGPAIFKTMPFEPKTDLVPVVLLGFFPAGIFVHKSVEPTTIAALLDYGRANPGKLNFATFGASTSSNIYASWLKNVRGADFSNVPYKSAIDAFRAGVSGEADIVYTVISAALPSIKKGDLRLLAVNNPRRLPDFPDVPTFEEVKIDAAATWFGLFASKGTSGEIIQRINTAVVRGLINDAEMKNRFLDKAGVTPSAPAGGDVASFAAFFQSELVVYENLVRQAKIEKMDR
jgi:tripartite-type tricarboxylate transporter receptor subunit TctC